MKWEELQPGDQLIPLESYSGSLDPVIVVEVTTRKGPAGTGYVLVGRIGIDQRDIIDLLFLNTRTATTFKEVRYATGSAGIGFQIIRNGERVA